MESNNGASFVDPKAVLLQVEIQLGSVIADFGCGAGHFSVAAAMMTGEQGRVYAFDILKTSLEAVAGQAKNLELNNILPKRVNLEKIGGSKLENDSVDMVIMKDMLFQNQHKNVILQEAYRVLKPGGKALIVEWNTTNLSMGPDGDLRIAPDKLDSLVVSEKFSVLKKIDAGDFHYGVLVSK